MQTGAILSIMVAVAAGYIGNILYRHEQRDLKVGSLAATPEMVAHESWEAVVDNYVYIHNAFRNDLQSIITSCEEDKFAIGDLEQWKEILDLHSRVEDEIIVVALRARLKQKKDSNDDDIPEELLSGNGHDTVKQLISKSLECSDNLERMKLLKELAVELDNHLKMEEETMMHLLIENFTRRELWALDSFIVNPKLGYCDKDTLIKITFWWFKNISLSEGKELLGNFIKAGKQPPMPLGEWKQIQDDIPALQQFSIEDIMS